MFVGVARLSLHLPLAASLKDKRQVVRSFKDRVRARLHLSIAEVGDADRLQLATLGVAVISADSAVCYDLLAKVRAMAGSLPSALVSDWRSSVVSFGRDGKTLLDETPFAFQDDDET